MPTYNRPYKMFTVIVEMASKLDLVFVRAHDTEHAKRLASRQVDKAGLGLRRHRVMLVLRGYAQVAA